VSQDLLSNQSLAPVSIRSFEFSSTALSNLRADSAKPAFHVFFVIFYRRSEEFSFLFSALIQAGELG
jgi:hypothetical protein